MSTIASGIPTTALTTGTAYMARLLRMADGRRVVVYTNGTNLLLKHSATGATWSSAITVLAGVTALPATMVILSVGDAVHVYRTSGLSILATRVPYSGGGTFGTVATSTIGTVTTAPASLRAVFDPDGTTTDTDHVAGTTGIVHLLLDRGTTWEVWALDPHTSNTIKPKKTVATTQTVPLLSPQYNADITLRQGGPNAAVYVLGSGSASDGWVGEEFAYTAAAGAGAATTSLARPSGPFNNYYQQDTTVGSPTFGQWFYGQLLGGHAYFVTSDQAGAVLAGQGNPLSGWMLPNASGRTFSGTWAVGLDLQWNIPGITGSASVQLTIYTISGGVRTQRGRVSGSPISFPGGAWYAHLTASGTIPAFSTGAGDAVYVEIDIVPSGLLTYHQSAQVAWSGVTVNDVTVSNPAGASGPSHYAAGPVETPALPVVAQGAALMPDGSAGVDILLNDGGAIKASNRTALGAYQPVLPVATGATTGVRPQGAVNPQASVGTQAVVFHKASHLWSATRLSGAWGTPAQEDTSSTAVQTGFAAVEQTGLGVVGRAIAYVNGTGPYDLIFEDAGFSAGAVTPNPPVVSLIPHSGTTDADTALAVATATSLTPLIRVVFQSAATGAPLGAIAFHVTDDDASGAVVWDSGTVSVTNGPVSGHPYDVEYGSIGAAATALTLGHHYTMTVTTTEAVGGNVSAGTVLHFVVYTGVTVTAISPDTFSTLTPTVIFTPNQAEGVTLTAYRYQLLAPDGTTRADTGYVTGTLTAGSPVSITPALAGSITNGVPYRQIITVLADPGSGYPQFTGTGTLPVLAAVPTADVPVIDSAAWVPSTTPFDGGVAEVVYHEPSGAIAAVTITIYTQIDNGPWTLFAQRPVPSGSDTVDIHDLNNNETVRIGISATSAAGVESGMAVSGLITASFKYGIWVIQKSDPTIKLELGLVPKDSPDLGWDVTQDVDDAEIFDRGAPVTSVGTVWYRISTELTYTLPRGFEEAMTLQMEQWNREGTPVLVKDPDGLSHTCRVLRASRTHQGTTKIRALTASFKEIDA